MQTKYKTCQPGEVYTWQYGTNDRQTVVAIAIGHDTALGVIEGERWAGSVPDDAVLMVPADSGVDVPPGQPRVVVRDLPEKLNLLNEQHRAVFDRALSMISSATDTAEMRQAVTEVRGGVGAMVAEQRKIERMEHRRAEAREMLTGVTAEERVDLVADLLRQVYEGCDHMDELDYRS
jgi:hypothetical protein